MPSAAHDAKTKLVWFGSRSNLTNLASCDCSPLVGGNIIKPFTTDGLSVLLSSKLSLKQHVYKVVSSCSYELYKHFANKRPTEFWKSWHAKFRRNINKDIVTEGCQSDTDIVPPLEGQIT